MKKICIFLLGLIVFILGIIKCIVESTLDGICTIIQLIIGLIPHMVQILKNITSIFHDAFMKAYMDLKK